MSTPPRRLAGRNWEVTMVVRPWYVDLATFVLVGVWMAWTFATMQQYGPSLPLIAGAVVVALVGLLVVYGQRLKYLRIGERFEIGLRTPEDYDETKANGGQEREQYR